VTLGGPAGQEVELVAGDVAVLPAGTGHRNVGSEGNLLVVGAYPPGQVPDLLTGDPSEREAAVARILRVALPTTDPVIGTNGPLVGRWGRPPGAPGERPS
jgi:uncharacterized protein YjlB